MREHIGACILGAYLLTLYFAALVLFRYYAIVNFPVFGVPVLASLMSFICLLWWFVSYVFLALPAAFGWALVGLCSFFVVAGVPIWGALFAFLLREAEAKVEPAAAVYVAEQVAPHAT